MGEARIAADGRPVVAVRGGVEPLLGVKPLLCKKDPSLPSLLELTFVTSSLLMVSTSLSALEANQLHSEAVTLALMLRGLERACALRSMLCRLLRCVLLVKRSSTRPCSSL